MWLQVTTSSLLSLLLLMLLLHLILMLSMNLSLLSGGNGLQVVHCVMFPYANTSVPICAMDLVGWGDNVTLCIADVRYTCWSCVPLRSRGVSYSWNSLPTSIVPTKLRVYFTSTQVCPSTVHLHVPKLFDDKIPLVSIRRRVWIHDIHLNAHDNMFALCLTLQMQKQLQLEGHREIPEWGKEIFSQHCLCMRPSCQEEVAVWTAYRCI